MRDRNATLIDVAPVSMACLAACIVYYVYLGYLSMSGAYEGGGSLWSINADVLMDCGASSREGVWDGGWQRFVLPMFMHGGILHILFNMMWLYQLGPSLERHFGSANFGSVYFLSGLGCICLSQLCGGHLSVGASGCVFGMMGAVLATKVAAAYDWRRAMRSSEVRDSAFYVGMLFFICFFIPHVDHWGHLGGLVLGFLYGWLFEHWRKHHRVGVAALAALLIFTAAGVVACRWMTFNPHYHVHKGIVAETKGESEDADRHFGRAMEWAKVWRSERAGWELIREAEEAKREGKFNRSSRYQVLIRYVAPRNFYRQFLR